MSGTAVGVAPTARVRPATRRLAVAAIVPLALFGIALAVRALVIGLVDFPANEGSAYYTAVAANLVGGAGLTTDALWSYATPPLVVPRPAFELWQPLASLLAALPMLVMGPAFDAAQVGAALLGATLAPLAYLVTLEAAAALRISPSRRRLVLAAGSGLLVAVSAPLLTATALPDSTLPFTVAAVAAALLLSRTLAVVESSQLRPALLLGALLGIAWLARHEAIWLALATVLVAALAGRLGRRFLLPVVAGGLAVVSPWLARNLFVFGSPLPGQTVENALLTANEQIYAYTARPELDAFLAQGAATIAGNIVAGAAHNLFAVLIAPAAPAIVAGLLAAAWLAGRRSAHTTALATLLLSGGLTYVVASVVFPVASRWGTFEHSAGPLVVGLAVAGVLGLDALIEQVGRRRGWRRDNSWLAPLALVALSLPLSTLVVAGLAAEADRQAAMTERLATTVLAQPEAAAGGPLIADHPIWLAEATGRPAIALPAEPLASVLQLARDFGARVVVVSAPRGEYPALLRSDAGRACFDERDEAVFVIRPECLP